jgi:fluoride ion exporter CrcB/FEX
MNKPSNVSGLATEISKRAVPLDELIINVLAACLISNTTEVIATDT